MNWGYFFLYAFVKALYEGVTALGMVCLLTPKYGSQKSTWLLITLVCSGICICLLPLDNNLLQALTTLGINLCAAIFLFRGSLFRRLFVVSMFLLIETGINIVLWGYFFSVFQGDLLLADFTRWGLQHALMGYWVKFAAYLGLSMLVIRFSRHRPWEITDHVSQSVYSYAVLQTIGLSVCLLILSESTQEFTPGMAGAFLTVSVASSILLAVLLQLVRYEADTEAENYLTEYQLSTQKAAFNTLQEEAFRVRTARHDLRNNIMVIQGMLAAGQYSAAAAYIEKIQPPMPSFEFAPNLLIESLLTSRSKRLAAQGISLQCPSLIEDTAPLDVVSFCDVAAFLVDLAVLADPNPNFPIVLQTHSTGKARRIQVSLVPLPRAATTDLRHTAFADMRKKYARLHISTFFSTVQEGETTHIRAVCLPAPVGKEQT